MGLMTQIVEKWSASRNVRSRRETEQKAATTTTKKFNPKNSYKIAYSIFHPLNTGTKKRGEEKRYKKKLK